MNLPNKLTILRIFLTLLFLVFICIDSLLAKIIATALFIAASITDFFDGYYARKHNLTSDFGKIMDPIADKFLILAAFLVFAKMEVIVLWMFIIVAIREIGVTASRIYQVKKGMFVAAENSGKIKTVMQIVTIIFILFYLIFSEVFVIVEGSIYSMLNRVIYGMMFAVVVITTYSGIEYFKKNRKSIVGSEKK